MRYPEPRGLSHFSERELVVWCSVALFLLGFFIGHGVTYLLPIPIILATVAMIARIATAVTAHRSEEEGS